MPLFFELLSRTVHLDLIWFIELFFNNLFWVFAFAMIAYFTMGKNKVFTGTLLIFVILWITCDFPNYIGWTLLAGSFLSVHYIVKMALVTFTENVECLKKYFLLINTLQFVFTLAAFNLLRGFF